MAHGDVYKWFELYFPQYAGEKTEVWFPNGKNSICVRQTNKQEFVFTCNGKDDWRFETVKSFINGGKEKR